MEYTQSKPLRKMTKVKSGRALWNSNAARLGGSEAVMHWTIIPFEISLDYTNLIDVNCFFLYSSTEFDSCV